MCKKITITLVDDHAVVRAGIRSLVESIEQVEVINETGDGLEAISLIKKSNPTIAILDISLPSLNGIEVLSALAKFKLKTKVLILSMHNDVEYVAKALREGAHGYLMKESAVEELEKAIIALQNGRQYIGSNINLDMLKKLTAANDKQANILSLLTGRQRQILQQIAEGYSTRQIAGRINVSIKTVETHRSHIMSRLSIFDIAGLVRFAIRSKLIT